MHAAQMAEEYPVVSMDTDALEAARLLAEHQLPGIVVTDADGSAAAVLPASQVVRFLVPKYVQDDPSLAGVLTESMCDRSVEKLRGKKVRDVIPERLSQVPAAKADDTIVEVAAMMARLRCPLIAVTDGDKLLGIITASRLLAAALNA
ncbi:CBS domain-containing protein [Nocardia mexicana]|uniref:CBS domain protein n=1 Tax=Nocardia mexicana TaxID=279262 RepID=A0A370GPN2_9NOCA|nr:CBS domain-containing protein [Nocardia mexicana]RDI44434.1 CBS domain protein [Nocardia mexicana]